MDLASAFFGLIVSVTGLVSFINVNTILEFSKYLPIVDVVLFAVVLSFGRIPFEILSFSLMGAFSENTAVATSSQVSSFNVLLKQSIAAMLVALLLLPASTYILPLIWNEVKMYSILLAGLIFLVVSFKHFKKNILDALAVVILAGICGIITLRTLSSSGLFPLLSGLYAIPVLLLTAKKEQTSRSSVFSLKTSIAGAVAALFTSLLPATGVSIVAILFMALFALESLAFQALVFSVYSARVVFDFANVYTIGKARSMAATLLPYTLSYDEMLVLILIGVCAFLLACVVAYFCSKELKKVNLNDAKVKLVLIALIAAAVGIQNGPFGVLVLVTSSLIGLYAAKCENRLLMASSLLAGALSTLF